MKHLIVFIFSAVMTFAYGCTIEDGIKVISATEFKDSVNTDTSAVIIDVRTAEEFEGGHIDGAINIDMKNSDLFDKSIAAFDNTKTYYIYCRSGRRSHMAAAKIQAAGFKAFDMKGGIIAWKDSGFPIKVSLK